MEVMHERVAGLDVHKAMIVACVRVMSEGKVKRECRTFETSTAGLEALLDWLTASGCTHVAMEATGVYWKPVWNILSDGAFELIVANAAHIKNVPGRKTDVNDATWIADLVACGLIRASFVPDETIQELRSLLRARKQLTRDFSERSLLCFSQPRRSRRQDADRLSRCWMSRLAPRPGCAVDPPR